MFGIVFIFVFERMKREDEEKEKRREEKNFQKHLLFVFSFLYFFTKQLQNFLKIFSEKLKQTHFHFLFSIFSTQKVKNSFWNENQTQPKVLS